MYGNDYEYAGTRLLNTIVRLSKNNEPVVIKDINWADGTCVFSYLSNKPTDGFCHIDELNLKPVRLGYCNYAGTCQYLSRIPMRRDYKQGLRGQTVYIPTGINFNTVPKGALRLTILGKYPTLERVMKETKSNANVFKGKSLAFHRHWAISNGRELLYKNGVKVGVVENVDLCLEDKFWHLKEYLERCMK